MRQAEFEKKMDKIPAKGQTMDISAYLKRLKLSGPCQADLPTLQALQRAHLVAIPFENLDIHLKRPIFLDETSLWDKLITRKRGGFCYEVNGLFAGLLKEIGFGVTYLNARDYHPEDDAFGIDFDHLTLLIQIPNDTKRWLVDVGYGDTFTQPLNIDDPEEQIQGLRGYWVEPFKNGYQLWQRNYDGSRERHYFFDLIPHIFPDEYLDTCKYHQSSPKSIFTQKRIVSRLMEDGRVSLDEKGLLFTRIGERESVGLKEDERAKALREYFDIIL
jgi:N-hydroxyarylamine O-acetyltransferase